MSRSYRLALLPSHILYVRSSFLCVSGGNVVVVCIFMPSPATVITSLQQTRLRNTYVTHNARDHVLLTPPSPGQTMTTFHLHVLGSPARTYACFTTSATSYVYHSIACNAAVVVYDVFSRVTFVLMFYSGSKFQASIL